MERRDQKQPKFWINPNTRLCFPFFRVRWHKCNQWELLSFCEIETPLRMTYHVGQNCVHILYPEDYAELNILYSEVTAFENIRLQKWLRVTIRDGVMERAKIVLPKRLHELEAKHNLYASSVTVKKLRKRVLGQCNVFKQIRLSPIIVIFPEEMMDDVILHEMAHLRHMHHRKSFWKFLSTLIGSDAEKQSLIHNIARSKYWELYTFLMK